MNRAKLTVLGSLVILAIVLSTLAARYTRLPGDAMATSVLSIDALAFLLPIMRAVSFFGNIPWLFVWPIAAGLGLYFAGHKYHAFFIASTLLCLPLGFLLKEIIQRPRPSLDPRYVEQQFPSFSFPSSHVLFYVVFFGFLYYLARHQHILPKPIVLFIEYGSLFLLLFVGPSRIYLRAHWLSDIVGGYIVGTIVLFCFITLYTIVHKKTVTI